MVYTSTWAGTHPDVSLKSIVLFVSWFPFEQNGFRVCVLVQRLRTSSRRVCNHLEWQPIKFEDTLKDSQIEFRTISQPSLRVSRPYLGREESFYLSLFLGAWYICTLSFVRVRNIREFSTHTHALNLGSFLVHLCQFQFFPVTQHAWKEEALLRESTTENEKEEQKE